MGSTRGNKTTKRRAWNKGLTRVDGRIFAARLTHKLAAEVEAVIAEARLSSAEVLRMAIEDGLPTTRERLRALRAKSA